MRLTKFPITEVDVTYLLEATCFEADETHVRNQLMQELTRAGPAAQIPQQRRLQQLEQSLSALGTGQHWAERQANRASD